MIRARVLLSFCRIVVVAAVCAGLLSLVQPQGGGRASLAHKARETLPGSVLSSFTTAGSPFAQDAFVGSSDGDISLVNIATGTEVAHSQMPLCASAGGSSPVTGNCLPSYPASACMSGYGENNTDISRLWMSPDGRHLYVNLGQAGRCTGEIGGLYTLDVDTGAFTQVQGLSSLTSGFCPYWVMFNPAGTAYVMSSSYSSGTGCKPYGNVYSIAASSGSALAGPALTPYRGGYLADVAIDGNNIAALEVYSSHAYLDVYAPGSGTATASVDLGAITPAIGNEFGPSFSVLPNLNKMFVLVNSGPLDIFTAAGVYTSSLSPYAGAQLAVDANTGSLATSDFTDKNAWLDPAGGSASDATLTQAEPQGLSIGGGGQGAAVGLACSPACSTPVMDAITITGSSASVAEVPVGGDGIPWNLSGSGVASATDAAFAASTAPPVGGLLALEEMFPGNSGEPCVACALKAAEQDADFVTASAGDPVDTATGDLSESYTDSSVASYGPPLGFTRGYNSELAEMGATTSTPGPLGYGWSEPWDASISVTGSGAEAAVNLGSGAADYFVAPSGGACTVAGQVDPSGAGTAGTFCAPPRVTATLTTATAGSSTTYTDTLTSGLAYSFEAASSATTFPLSSITDPDSVTQSIELDTPAPGGSSPTCPSSIASSCETILDPGSTADRKLVLAFNASGDTGQIVAVTNDSGQQWRYGYDSSDDLTSVTDPRGDVTSYVYGNDSTDSGDTAMAHDLIGIVRPNNQGGAGGLTLSAITSFCEGDSGAPGSGMVFCYANPASGGGYGQVVEQADPLKRLTTYAFDDYDPSADSGYNTVDGGQTTVTDPDGNTTVFDYAYDELTSETITSALTGLSSTQTLARDPGLLLPLIAVDPDGNQASMAYDNFGDLVSKENALGQTWTWSYNSFGEPVCETLPEQSDSCSSGLLSPAPPGTITRSGTTTITPPSAPPPYTTYIASDQYGDLNWASVGRYSPSGTLLGTATSYDLYSGEQVTVDGDTDECSATPPSQVLACAIVAPTAADTQAGADAVTQLGYDADGDVDSTSKLDGNAMSEAAETTSTYYPDGQLETVVAPLGNIGTGEESAYTTTYGYNNDGWLNSVDQGTGSTERETSYGYDDDGNVTTAENADSQTTTTNYDADDEEVYTTDPRGNSTLSCYDNDGNLTEVVPPAGVAADDYTKSSCPASFSDPASATAAASAAQADDADMYAYDALGHVVDAYTPEPYTTASGYGSTWETTSDEYDPDGRLIASTSPPADPTHDGGGVVTIDDYDDAGYLLASSTGTGSSLAVTSYCHDPDGDETAVVPPDGNSSATLGSDGLTLSGYASCATSSPYTTSSAYQTAFTYDSTGDLLTDTRPGSSTTTDTYDDAGQLATSENADGVTASYVYWPLGETDTTTYTGGSGTPTVTDSYDADGDLVKMVDGTGTSYYGHDNFGDLTSYENGAGQSVSWTYDDMSNPLDITYPLPSGTSWDTTATAVLAYNADGQVASLTDLEGNKTSFGYSADSSLDSISLDEAGAGTVSMTPDVDDNPESIEWTKGSTSLTYGYTYEPDGGIATETDSQGGTDASPSYAYDTLGRVTSGTASYGYDQSSNLTGLPGSQTGTYNDAGELTANTSDSFNYDSDGNRINEKYGMTTLTSATWNGTDELTSYSDAAADMTNATYDGSGLRQTATIGGTSQDFLWDPTSSVPELLEDGTNLYLYGPGDAPLEQMSLSLGKVRYLVTDALGSVRAVVNGIGMKLGTTSYDTYGTAGSTGVSANTPFGYAGGYTDATGLEYLVNRYYDPGTGQFISVDPMVNETLEPYGYAGGDPVNASDSTGTLTTPGNEPSLDENACLGNQPAGFSDTLAGSQPAEPCLTLDNVFDSPNSCAEALGMNGFASLDGFCNPGNSCGQSLLCTGMAWFSGLLGLGSFGVDTPEDCMAETLVEILDNLSAAEGGAVSADDLNTVRQYLSSQGWLDEPENSAMVDRIQAALDSGTPLTEGEQNFMTHEMTEANLVDNGMSTEDAHEIASGTHPPYSNYDPEVVRAYPQIFNQAWRDYWGIG